MSFDFGKLECPHFILFTPPANVRPKYERLSSHRRPCYDPRFKNRGPYRKSSSKSTAALIPHQSCELASVYQQLIQQSMSQNESANSASIWSLLDSTLADTIEGHLILDQHQETNVVVPASGGDILNTGQTVVANPTKSGSCV